MSLIVFSLCVILLLHVVGFLKLADKTLIEFFFRVERSVEVVIESEASMLWHGTFTNASVEGAITGYRTYVGKGFAKLCADVVSFCIGEFIP